MYLPKFSINICHMNEVLHSPHLNHLQVSRSFNGVAGGDVSELPGRRLHGIREEAVVSICKP